MPDATIDLTAGSSDRNAAVLAGFLGWTFDAFDWFIVTLCSEHIAKSLGVKATDITWCMTLTLMARPIGAFFFGLLADRYGRRRPMMINLIFYSSMSILSGFARSYWVFMLCRILFGIGMGGEWGVGASLAMEKIPVKFRGLVSGLLQEGYAFGGLLATAAYFFLYPHLQDWRPLFWIGGLPAILALFIRFFVKESAVWQKTKASNWGNLGGALLSHWRMFLAITLLMLMMNLSSHGTQDLFPKMLKSIFKLDPHDQTGFRKICGVNAVGFCGAIIGGMVVGRLSDFLGRRRAMVCSFILATLLVPLWAFAPTLALLVVGVFLLQFMVQGAWGVIPAHINELSPDSVRGVLPGFAYQCGAALSGLILKVEDGLAVHYHDNFAKAMAITAIVIFPIAAMVVAFGPESRGIVFGQTKQD